MKKGKTQLTLFSPIDNQQIHMIPVLGIPILNRGDLLIRNFNSIDYPVDTLCIIVNRFGQLDPSVKGALDYIKIKTRSGNHNVKNVLINMPTEPLTNLGVAGSWNRLFTLFPNAAYWLIAGNDIQFNPGDLEKMHSYTSERLDTHCILFGNWGFSLFAITPKSLDLVGTFDENIYPAYLEDCDYHYRCKILGGLSENVPEVNAIHGEAPTWGSSTIYANDEKYRAANGITHARNFEYYRAKWGGDNDKERYTHPFNNIELSPKTWVLAVERLSWN